jgi:cell division septum initiation protein DivIVA
MPRRFLIRRAENARAQAQRTVEVTDQQVARLVELATTLAERMDAMPSAGPERDLQRRLRVQVLRRTAEAGRRTLAARGDAGSDGQRRKHTA